MAHQVKVMAEKGLVNIVGGCCGTTREYIVELTRRAKDIPHRKIEKKNITCVSSYTHAIVFGDTPILIGERINPTGKKRLKEALRARDMDHILKEGIAQEEKGAHILDVNVGLPEIDESEMLVRTVECLQSVSALPLQIDTSDPAAMEKALRRYNGKAMINSVSGKKESMEAVFPLAKKYGGLVVALTLDDSGIPSTAEGRVEIARRILRVAQSYGIDKKDIIFDPLALTVSADKNAAVQTLNAIRLIREELGCHTSLGVSNVSFGLPVRDVINGAFFTLALGQGLSAAIMNPHSSEMMKAYYAYKALCGLDDNCGEYISFAQGLPTPTEAQAVSAPENKSADSKELSDLQRAIIKGLKEEAAIVTEALLKDRDPLEVVNEEIIPALNTVGEGFEKKTVYLPQLLMSAESAKAAFEIIKSKAGNDRTGERCQFVIATVKGDIHDIGKNIVKLILENYGFCVTDLGRDVAPEIVAEKVVALRAPLVGLSALMTTTVPAMEETVRLLREKAPWCKIVVGGAVLNEEYAAAIGADKYAKDAMETVRYAEEVEKSLL